MGVYIVILIYHGKLLFIHIVNLTDCKEVGESGG